MTFQQWVDSVNGVSAAARLLNVPQTTVSAWYHFERFPRPHNLQLIAQVSGRAVDNDVFRGAYLDAQKEVKA